MSGPLEGRATPEATLGFALDRAEHLTPARGVRLGATELRVSGAGFGCYRIHISSAQHREALEFALRSGINLIDASANYGDGGAEELVGVAIADLIARGDLKREQVVVVTKGGYIQGQNMEIALAREAEENPFPDVVHLSPECWHCIHPVFLEDQITRSLERMQLACADVYLLHNPEYFLELSAHNERPLEQARDEYYRRIREAFIHLEAEVARGRIAFYGISSNTFPHPETSATFTSLERCWQIAESISSEHHFRAIQLPANLLEQGAWNEPNQASGTTTAFEFAHEKDLGVLINRPLNAFTARRLVRLADPPPNSLARGGEIESAIDGLSRFEAQGAGSSALCELLKKQGILAGSEAQWHSFLSHEFIPRAREVIHAAAVGANDVEEFQAWQEEFIALLNALLEKMGDWIASRGRPRLDAAHEALAPVLSPALAEAPLSQKAIWALRSLPGVSSVLVGMRRVDYVEDVLAALRIPPGALTRSSFHNASEKLLGAAQ